MGVLVVWLLVLTAWPVLAGGLALGVAWGVVALVGIGGPVGDPGASCDYEVREQPQPGADWEADAPNVTRLSEWRTRRATACECEHCRP
ncbi:MAG TPA: hypothetical protein VGK51_08670 [Actinomycetota bacterium]|jgi:hypothetical protein